MSEVHVAKKHLTSTHGHTRNGVQSPTYRSWMAMKSRCFNRNFIAYSKYGARGITVCERWLEFANFLADMGERPDGTSIDRIDNEGNYEPGNCRWATRKEQGRNIRTNRLVEFNGQKLPVTEWAEKIGIKATTLHMRLNSCSSIERALSAKQLLPQRKRRNPLSRLITFRGETLALYEWAKKLDIKLSMVRNRLHRGMSPEEALTKPRRPFPTSLKNRKSSTKNSA